MGNRSRIACYGPQAELLAQGCLRGLNRGPRRSEAGGPPDRARTGSVTCFYFCERGPQSATPFQKERKTRIFQAEKGPRSGNHGERALPRGRPQSCPGTVAKI